MKGINYASQQQLSHDLVKKLGIQYASKNKSVVGCPIGTLALSSCDKKPTSFGPSIDKISSKNLMVAVQAIYVIGIVIILGKNKSNLNHSCNNIRKSV